MPDREIQGILDKLATAGSNLQAALKSVPDGALHRAPAAGDWSVGQVVGHVCEMGPLWMGKVVLMVRQRDPDISRTQQDAQARLTIVSAHAHDSRAEMERNLSTALDTVRRAAARLTAADLGRPGHLPGGPTTVRQVIEGRVIEHIEGHARQVASIRQALAG